MAFSPAAKSSAKSTPSSSPKPSTGSVIPPHQYGKLPHGIPVQGTEKGTGKKIVGTTHGTNAQGTPQAAHYSTGKVHLLDKNNPLKFHSGRLGQALFGKRVRLNTLARQSLRGKGNPTLGVPRTRSLSQPKGPSIGKGTPLHGLHAKTGAHTAGVAVGMNALNQPLVQSPSDSSIHALKPSTVRLHGTGTTQGIFLGGSHSLSKFVSGSQYGSTSKLLAGGSSLGV